MKRHLSLPVFMIFLLTSLPVLAQNLTRNAVLNMRIRDTGTIQMQDVVKGYYFFYNLEKKGGGNINYMLTVVDENLNEVNATTIIRNKNFHLIESSYNGKTFAFLFYDTSNKMLELVFFNQQLKQLGSRTTWIKNSDAAKNYAKQVESPVSGQLFLLPVKNEGFIYFDNSGSTYALQFLDSMIQTKWAYSEPQAQKGYDESAGDGFVIGPYIGSIITSSKGKDVNSHLIVLDRQTGTKHFRVPLTSGDFEISPREVRYDSASAIFNVFGEYYHKDRDNLAKDESVGFCNLSLSDKGETKAFKNFSWVYMRTKAPLNEKGKMDGSNIHIMFHDFIMTADGKIFGIGEQYGKAPSAKGMGFAALNLLAAATTGYYATGIGMTQMNVYNLVLLEFTPNYELEKVHVFEKNTSQIQLPEGAMYMSPKKLSLIVKEAGGFDYRFNQLFEDKNSFACIYTDFEKQKAQGIIGTVVRTPEKTFVVDKMTMQRKMVIFGVTRAKPGYILIAEYFRNEKRFDARLEKINY